MAAWLVESPRSALALLALSERTGQPMLPVGMGGAWGWRRGNGFRELPNGAHEAVTAPSPSLDLLNWTGRAAVVVLDVDVRSNPSVAAAQRALAAELAARGASVRIASIPAELGPKAGLDDLLEHSGDDAALKMLDAARPFTERAQAAAGDAKERDSQAAQLVKMTEAATLYRTSDSTAMVTVQISGHAENYAVRSKRFRQWLSLAFYRAHGKPPSAQAMSDATGIVEAKCSFDGAPAEFRLRVAGHAGHIYIDLGTPLWEAVCVSESGWSIEHEVPPKFRRGLLAMAFPTPAPGGSLLELRQFLNLKLDSQWAVVAGYLVAALRPTGPYPILILTGEGGTAKTTCARVLRLLLDPSAAPVRHAPKDLHDLAIAAESSHLLVFDNVSTIPQWFSDGLCCLATGGGFATRELYSDSEERAFSASRPTIITSIEDVAGRSDLLGRALVLELAVIADKDRQPEESFWARFEAARPRILGALLDAVSAALRRLASVKLERLPRMADFCRWAAAAEPSFGLPHGTSFLAAYAANQADANDLSIEASQISAALLGWLPAAGWEGTAGQLLPLLTKQAGEEVARQRGWPKTARALAGELRRVAPNLRATGADIELLPRAHGGQRRFAITRKPTGLTVTTVTTVTGAESKGLNGDAFGDGSGGREAQPSPPSPENWRKHCAGDGGDGGDGGSRPS
ncbi:MAG: hypothetical protein ACRD04_05260, partial [Terriglobales bacterium]